MVIKELGNYSGKKGNQRIDNGFEIVEKFGDSVINYDGVRSNSSFILSGVVIYCIGIIYFDIGSNSFVCKSTFTHLKVQIKKMMIIKNLFIFLQKTTHNFTLISFKLKKGSGQPTQIFIPPPQLSIYLQQSKKLASRQGKSPTSNIIKSKFLSLCFLLTSSQTQIIKTFSTSRFSFIRKLKLKNPIFGIFLNV